MKKPAHLRVHVVEGRLWCQENDPEPYLYGDIDRFLGDCMIDEFASIRLIGMRCNAELITKLYEEKIKTEVCTPAIVEKHADRCKPVPVLYELGLCARGPSQGGFHEVVESDYHAYKLAAAIDVFTVSGLLLLLEQHPGWKAMRFINATVEDTAYVLAHLIDPRWYIDECYPDRCSKFWSALGLNLHTQAIVTRSVLPRRNNRVDICYHTMGAWKHTADADADEVKKLFELAGTWPIADSALIGLRPGDFCWRVWGRYKDPVKADLRASQRFASYLRQTWLNEIYRNSSALPEERAVLFRPADFFEDELEVHAYEQYSS